MERLGRSTHKVYGRGISARLRSWNGSKYIFEDFFFPKDQWGHTQHHRHPQGYNENGSDVCVSKSVSYYSDLIRYGEFRWVKPDED